MAPSPDAEPSVAEVRSPYPTIGVSTAALDYLTAEFDAHHDAALIGDPASMLKIAHVIQNCILIGDFRSAEDFVAQSAQLPPEYIDAVLARIEDCSYINDQVPTGMPYDEWSYRFLKGAADKGNVLAQVEILTGMPPSQQNFSTTATLLEEAVKTRNYLAYYHAANFLGNYLEQDEDLYQLEYSKWLYLGCSEHPECDEGVMLENLEVQYLPSQIEDIQQGVRDIQAKIRNGEMIGFAEIRTPQLEPFSMPLK